MIFFLNNIGWVASILFVLNIHNLQIWRYVVCLAYLQLSRSNQISFFLYRNNMKNVSNCTQRYRNDIVIFAFFSLHNENHWKLKTKMFVHVYLCNNLPDFWPTMDGLSFCLNSTAWTTDNWMLNLVSVLFSPWSTVCLAFSSIPNFLINSADVIKHWIIYKRYSNKVSLHEENCVGGFYEFWSCSSSLMDVCAFAEVDPRSSHTHTFPVSLVSLLMSLFDGLFSILAGVVTRFSFISLWQLVISIWCWLMPFITVQLLFCISISISLLLCIKFRLIITVILLYQETCTSLVSIFTVAVEASIKTISFSKFNWFLC